MAGTGDVVEQYITTETLESKTKQWIQGIGAYRWRRVESLEPAQT